MGNGIYRYKKIPGFFRDLARKSGPGGAIHKEQMPKF